ncbi:putative methyl-accepting chemotaxis protein YoaH [Clostridium tepidiprofundi DSM 19306]|uniref:Putative methyl-accepting chemotaxis protein YoaH n=1 Tax=Clostridium tepidiprofundi DSM 19306 TaxID=1121338 RepID=A0A151B2R1_9CLOT|nr:methyl-accepting chemotaxis protein [Clostridium tepidiprofundi]KYH34198.1 putative methyl-accepting chemotaxis protein YoaH [Clostridium tepidiprofundi DSM 19306]
MKSKDLKINEGKNMLKNIKITHLLAVLSIIAFVSIMVVSAIAIKGMKQNNENMESLYNDTMMTSLDIKKLETEFYSIRLQMAKITYLNQYDEKAVAIVEYKKENVFKLFHKYKNSNMTEEQRKLFNDVEQNYKRYLDRVETFIRKIIRGTIISEEESKELTMYADAAQNSISSLVKLNEKIASEVIEKSNKEYKSSITSFYMIFLGFIILFTIFSLMLIKLIKGSMKKLHDALLKLAKYDFSIELDESGKNEFSDMNRELAAVVHNMKYVLAGVKDNSENLVASSQNLSAMSQQMASSSNELSNTMQQVSNGAVSQTQDLNDIAKIISQLTDSIENVYLELQRVKNETENTSDKANIGKREMDNLIKSINEIKNAFEIVVDKVSNLTKSVRTISGFTDIISGIADQTNLLALNAAIEAARAGETGKGFAVVADEIRKLAEESRKSTDEIVKLVSSINSDTDEVISTAKDVENFIAEQSESIEKTVNSFGDILISVQNIAPLMERTYNGMDEIVNSKDKVLRRVEEVSSVTEENSAAAEEVAASSEELTSSTDSVSSMAQKLSDVAEELMDIVRKFKV